MSDFTTTKELLREAIGKHQALPLDVQQLGAVAEIMATCVGMAVQERDTLQSKLTEMEQCLQWCSENVWWIERFAVNAWGAGWTASRTKNRGDTSPTLYAALKSAWDGREK